MKLQRVIIMAAMAVFALSVLIVGIVAATSDRKGVDETPRIEVATPTPKPTPTPTPEVVVEEPTPEATPEPTPEPTPTPEPVVPTYSSEAIMIAKVIYSESRGIYSQTEQACVAWTILNRADAYGSSVAAVITAPNQFAYVPSAPTVDDYGRDLVALAQDVLDRWYREKAGETNVGRVLPQGYLYYHGDGKHNYFRQEYGNKRNVWDYAWGTVYGS